jgi:hypothetical protein
LEQVVHSGFAFFSYPNSALLFYYQAFQLKIKYAPMIAFKSNFSKTVFSGKNL